MRNKALSILMGAALSLATVFMPAVAAVVPFPQPGWVLMNFDLSGAQPGPLFDSIELTIPRDVGTAMGCLIFADLMVSPSDMATAHLVNGCASFATTTYTYTDPEMLDGMFSIAIGLGPAATTVTDPFAVGIRDGVHTADVLGSLVPGQSLVGLVSEPGSLGLAGLALVAALGRRQRPALP